MKVKVIDIDEISRDSTFEDTINEFIKDKKIIDIKYQSNISLAANESMSSTEYGRSVLIMYEEEKNDHIS